MVVLLVDFEVLGKLIDRGGQYGDLDVGGAGIARGAAEFRGEFGFLFFGQGHDVVFLRSEESLARLQSSGVTSTRTTGSATDGSYQTAGPFATRSLPTRRGALALCGRRKRRSQEVSHAGEGRIERAFRRGLSLEGRECGLRIGDREQQRHALRDLRVEALECALGHVGLAE